ncbi:Protein BPS1 chloroplastic [Quillaja saponaria]|uniref:Protein BPS1 chloroplastic n=1 Tax=Quillaja saponaria TaxID=32244 RepID=A0AAD7PDR5_QUISA|nr:Protein BPS1 chloroplastic [Quillaja saponaria]
MSRPQDPQRSLFSFGNPFRMISSKGSRMSPRLLAELNAFEETLANRMRKLMPKDKDEVLSLTWMKLAIELVSETHNDVKTLITKLDLPVCDWDEKWIDVYLDISVKLLDICIAFSSELSRLNQGHLLLQCALHNLDSSKQFIRAYSSLDCWRQHITSKNPRVENCRTILDSIVKSIDLPKVKNSAKEKVLMRAMYGVKVLTVYICSVFSAGFTSSAEKLLDLNVADSYLWAQAFNNLQSTVNEEIRKIFSSERSTTLKELKAVDACVKKMYSSFQDGAGAVEVESPPITSADLGRRAEELSQGLNHLAEEVDGFFQVVLSGRDSLLSNLRASGTVFDQTVGGNVEKQLVR